MKFNWGTKIALLYIGFVVLMIVLVVKSMNQDFQLVSDDYYQKEIKFQDVLDGSKNQSQLSAPITIHANEKSVILDFPEDFNGKEIKGKIQFYSAVTSKWDANFDVKTNQNSMTIDRQKLHTTPYLVKVVWEVDGKKYYEQDSLNLAH